jgi:hypothetical protein
MAVCSAFFAPSIACSAWEVSVELSPSMTQQGSGDVLAASQVRMPKASVLPTPGITCAHPHGIGPRPSTGVSCLPSRRDAWSATAGIRALRWE